MGNVRSVALIGEGGNDAPAEETFKKAENPLDFDKEPSPLPEVVLKPEKPKNLKRKIKKVDNGEFEVHVG